MAEKRGMEGTAEKREMEGTAEKGGMSEKGWKKCIRRTERDRWIRWAK